MQSKVNACFLGMEVREMENNNWIPVSSGIFPDDMEDVQVTFIGYNDHAPHCEAFAYRNDEKWYWSLDDCEVKVEITAWKKNVNRIRQNNKFAFTLERIVDKYV